MRATTIALVLCACDRSPPPPPPPAPVPPTSASPASPTMLDPPSAPGAMAPNLVASGRGVLLSWLEPGDAPGAHRLRMAELAGGRWTAPRTVVERAEILANWADVPSVMRQDARILVAHWTERSGRGEACDAIVARSVDDGLTWQTLGPVHRDRSAVEHAFVSLVPDGDATLAVWLDGRGLVRDGGATSLRAARIGAAIGDEQVLDDRVCDCCSTAAVTTGDGPVVVYRDRSADELRDPAAVRRVGDRWQASQPVHDDRWHMTGCPVNGPASAASGADLVVAWYTLADQRPTVRVAFSRDAGAHFAAPITLDETRGARTPAGRVDAVLVARDDAVISWIASEGARGDLLVRRVTADGRRGAELAIATLAAAGRNALPRMERVDDDLLLAWPDTAGKTLQVARLPLSAVPPPR